jgi:alanine racemase
VSRPTRIDIDVPALLKNVSKIKQLAPQKEIIAMVKANAYGCGIKAIAPHLEGQVDAFGVASLEEAMAIRALGCKTPCIVFHGAFNKEELPVLIQNQCAVVLHTPLQLQEILNTPLSSPLTVWVKVNTGMNRLGFQPQEIKEIIHALKNCPWVHPSIGLMTHLASADDASPDVTLAQLALFKEIDKSSFSKLSIANSAGILRFPEAHQDVVRPGIMLYGVSPFANQCGRELGLAPVMRFLSAISAVHHIKAHEKVGYGGVWTSDKPSIIGIVAAGYGDGYPRHMDSNARVWVNGCYVSLAGRVSMDMMAVDLTLCPSVKIGDSVELWGSNLPVEEVAKWAGTSPYELICQVSERVRVDRFSQK